METRRQNSNVRGGSVYLRCKILNQSQESTMTKSTRTAASSAKQSTNLNHQSNQGNSNKGTNGTNTANAHVHGNRGGQLNPNRRSG